MTRANQLTSTRTSKLFLTGGLRYSVADDIPHVPHSSRRHQSSHRFVKQQRVALLIQAIVSSRDGYAWTGAVGGFTIVIPHGGKGLQTRRRKHASSKVTAPSTHSIHKKSKRFIRRSFRSMVKGKKKEHFRPNSPITTRRTIPPFCLRLRNDVYKIFISYAQRVSSTCPRFVVQGHKSTLSRV